MNFLVCDADWLQGADGSPVCSGQLITVTTEEMRELQGEVLVLFALVFGFLVLKKLL